MQRLSPGYAVYSFVHLFNKYLFMCHQLELPAFREGLPFPNCSSQIFVVIWGSLIWLVPEGLGWNPPVCDSLVPMSSDQAPVLLSFTGGQRCLPPRVTAWPARGLGADRRSQEQAPGQPAPPALLTALSSLFRARQRLHAPFSVSLLAWGRGRLRDAGCLLSFPHSVLTASCESVWGMFSVFTARALLLRWLSTLAARYSRSEGRYAEAPAQDSGRGGHRGFESLPGVLAHRQGETPPTPLGRIVVQRVGCHQPRCTGEGHEAHSHRELPGATQ